jgi:hypothetical protein
MKSRIAELVAVYGAAELACQAVMFADEMASDAGLKTKSRYMPVEVQIQRDALDALLSEPCTSKRDMLRRDHLLREVYEQEIHEDIVTAEELARLSRFPANT